ncbi:hypothetical protein FRC11_000987 [Ceratobasidium sp. 423]|nr:hypothetical protein FRC11_000987 [Ceratobasidium sp. 423]
MPTYAGYIMTLEHQLQWLRRAHPEIKADENHIPSTTPLCELIRKRKMSNLFEVDLVVVPGLPDPIWLNGNIELSRLALMFIRRTRSSGSGVWLPPREIPGVASDSHAGVFLKKCGLIISDWVVIHMPEGDPYAASWVRDPDAAC